MDSNKVLDAKGLACPMPIVKKKKAMGDIDTGEVLEVHTTDKGALNDLTAWAKSGGHDLLKHENENGVLKFWIKRVENKGDQ
jgi:tRNA 2-thiouridine synthesizing protein A